MTLDELAQALTLAGFVGVEPAPPLVYARGDGPSAPEFTAALTEGVRLTQRFDVRAPEAALADWKIGQTGRLAIVNGETHLTLTLAENGLADGLPEWRRLMQVAAKAAVSWRRSQKPLHGM